MLILIFGSQSSFRDDFGQSDAKRHYFTSLLCETLVKNSIAMTTPKAPGDKKLFEMVCQYIHTNSQKVSASYT